MYRIVKGETVEPIRKWAVEFTHTLGVDCNPDYYLDQWSVFLKTGIGFIWYLEYDGECVGGIGGIVAPDILSGYATMIELFWYITPSHRRRGIMLFDMMEQYVDDHNLRWAMIHMESSMPEKLKVFYTRRGFRLLETHWIRDAKGDKSCQ